MNGFSAADMSTAAANGFRDGLAAQPGAAQEAVAWQRKYIGATRGGVPVDWHNITKEEFELTKAGKWASKYDLRTLYAAPVAAAPEWQPIETAPEGGLVVVGWLDAEDSYYPENYDFDYLEDRLWAKHADCVEHAHAVAPPGSKMPKEQPPYQWWMDLPAFPAARPQGVKD